jgi:hypothetical protein
MAQTALLGALPNATCTCADATCPANGPAYSFDRRCLRWYWGNGRQPASTVWEFPPNAKSGSS